MAYSTIAKIAIDKSKCGGENTPNFAFMLSGVFSYFKSIVNGGKMADALARDIEFCSDVSGAVQYKYERVIHNLVTGEIQYFIKLPLLSFSADTVFFVRFGDPAKNIDLSDPVNVWDANFYAVYHCDDITPGVSINDSKGNANMAGQAGLASVQGVLGKAINYPSAKKSETVPGNIPLNTLPYTFECWFRRTAVTGGAPTFEPFFGIGQNFGSWLSIGFNQATGRLYWLGGVRGIKAPFVMDGNWHSIFGTVKANRLNPRLWVDNQEIGLGVGENDGFMDIWDTWRVFVGAPAGWNDFIGDRDEIRISTIERGTGYRIASYNNQFAPSSFSGVVGIGNVLRSQSTFY